MRRLHSYLFIFILVFSLGINAIPVYAMNTGFALEELPEKDKKIFVSNINISLLMEKPPERTIQCFDVNEKGMIAIGQNGTDAAQICIYSSDGVFRYGYSFNSRQSFGVEWDDDDINIYFVRSDVIISVNQAGEILDIAKVQNTIANNSYQYDLLYSTQRISQNTKYTLKNDMGILNVFASSYSQLIATNTAGEETILYNVQSILLTNTLTIFIVSVMFFLLAVVVISWQFIKLRRTGDGLREPK